MSAGYPIVYRLTQAEFDAGDAVGLTGGFVEIVDANGLPTGAMYLTGVSGTIPTVLNVYAFRNAGASIGSFNVVYDVDGVSCRCASSDDPSTVEQVLGLSVNTATSGQLVQIIRTGVYAGYTGLSGGAIYLGLHGVVTHTPATSGVHLQVGNAINDMVSDIDVKTPIYL
jgi:hypothetical protein